MLTLTPTVSTTPGNPVTYNVGMTETFSWIPIANNANRPIYARATYTSNLRDMSYTVCETRTSGNPSFTPREILAHNLSNSDVYIKLTLTSGMSCTIPIGKNTDANHILSLMLQVSSVQDYAGCTITYFA